ncbi:hypothetical protein TWF481_012243 [Arthrobotrys musiformis]|uniref:Uncharacterized protein n=1 Tax=Arthrobotrys musiformis TaxID=47236 RepID=A0AAV9VWJ3_9PEZI
MDWFKNAVQSHRHGRSRSNPPSFSNPSELEISVPRIQAASQNELLPFRPPYIENVDMGSFEQYRGALAESTNKGLYPPRSHDNEASYRALPNNAAEAIPIVRRKPVNGTYSFPGSQGGPVSNSNTPVIEYSSSPPTAISPWEPDSSSISIQRNPPPAENTTSAGLRRGLENEPAGKGLAVEEAIIDTEPALLAKDPFFFERIQFHVENAEHSLTKSDWDTALENLQVVYDIFKGVDISLMMRGYEKFLLLQRLIMSRCMAILAARFYADSVLHLSNQWNSLLKKEGLRDTKSQPWVDLVRILAYSYLEKYEEAQEGCQKYLRPDYIKDEGNADINAALNAYGFWLMAEILTKRGRTVEAKFYTSKIPKNMDEGIYFNWVSHCLSPPEAQIQQLAPGPKNASFFMDGGLEH